jgi:adenine/guanine/hypoxanthine permease
MPLTFSITNGLAFGLISYLVVKLIKKEYADINIGIAFLTLVSLIVFIVQ